MKKHLLPVALWLLVSPYSTFGIQFDSESEPGSNLKPIIVDPIVVTPNRRAQTEDETLASITVLEREDIERQQPRSFADALRGVPGLGLSNNGGPGKATSFFLRGAESDHVLVLLDGVKMGSATLGTTAFEHIPVEQIERVELVRGPRSSLYGSEAVGGVIQIFTRRGREATKPFFSLGGGRYATYEASAGVSRGGDRGHFSTSASGFDTEGFNACTGKPFPDGAGCFIDEPDRDGYRSFAGSLRAGYRFANGLDVDLHGLRSTGDSDFDGSFVNQSETVQQVLGGTLRIAPHRGWQMSVALGRSLDESDNFRSGIPQSRFNTERNSVSFQNDLSVSKNQLLSLGIDYQDDRIDTLLPFDVSSRDNQGIFAQYQGKVASHHLQLSLRQEDNEQFGSHTTGGAAWAHGWNKVRLTVSYGTAFKAPTFNELYFPGFGNAGLEPEESRSLELGLGGKVGRGDWSLNTYETRIEDLIAFDARIRAPANINEVRIRGVEILLTMPAASWTLSGNFTWLDPENRSSGAGRGAVLPRRARESFRFDAHRPFGKLTFGTSLRAEGMRYDDLANRRELESYATVDLYTEYALAKSWALQARAENLLNEDYETAAFFNQPQRGLYVKLRYRP